VDIVTHAVMGSIVAAPFFQEHPIAASCFVFGAVLPDLDAFSRLFGKRAFMKVHQTYTHALPIIAVIGLLSWPIFRHFDLPGLCALGLALGMTFHSLLDVTNTYGIALFLPFSKRRFSKEWVFFIDSVVALVSYPCLIFLYYRPDLATTVASAYVAIMALYWVLKARLRARALTHSPPGTQALLPSALWPWEFLGCARLDEGVRLFHINALNGEKRNESTVEIFDHRYLDLMDKVPEFQVMSALSPTYHVVQDTGSETGKNLLCRDLRTRNFKTRFGELEVKVDHSGEVKDLVFHV
jgi:membrane-bound metal-dependent hydrolase YbcI (DUF457 family)